MPQRVRRAQQDGAISSAEDSYLGKLLEWGNDNRDIFIRVLLDKFNALGPEVGQQITQIHNRTCVQRVYMPTRVLRYRLQHPPKQTFGKYLVIPPSGIDDGSIDSIMHMTVPRYDVDQLRVNGLSDKRKRSLAYAFKRVERNATAMEHIATLHKWIDHWRLHVAGAGDGGDGGADDGGDMADMGDAMVPLAQNPLHRYIMNGAGAAGGVGAVGAPLPPAAKSQPVVASSVPGLAQ